MKSEIKQVRPIFFNQQKLDAIMNFINKANKENSHYISLYKQKEILTELNNLLVDFTDDVEKLSKDSEFYSQRIYKIENLNNIYKLHSKEFMHQLDKMINTGSYVFACSPSVYVSLKNNNLKQLDISNKMYEEGKVINTKFMGKNDKYRCCANVGSQNLIVVFDGEYDGVNKNIIPLNQVCGGVDFTKGEIFTNKEFNPNPSKNYESIKTVEEFDPIYAQIEFNTESDYNILKQEFLEDAEYREDVVGDILYQTGKYLKNFFNEKCINKPSSTTLNEDLFKVINHTDLACQALEDAIITVNNSMNKSK